MGLETIPENIISKLKSVTRLNISCNSLTKMIPNNCSVYFAFLTHLNLNFNMIEEIPADIGTLSNLQVFYAAHNKITTIHRNIKMLTKLIVLDLSYNFIEEIPEEICFFFFFF
jgi:Leucine-rich repeat (LRR) protein